MVATTTYSYFSSGNEQRRGGVLSEKVPFLITQTKVMERKNMRKGNSQKTKIDETHGFQFLGH